MEKKGIDIRLVVLVGMLLLVGVWRVFTTSSEMSVWTQFTPIGAMALFAGTYFYNRTKAFLTPLIVLFISDIIIMQVIYAEYAEGFLYSGWYWIYGSFFIMVLIGVFLKGRSALRSVLLGSLLAAVSHFLITNFGVWLGGGFNVTTGLPYTKNLSGLIECYTLALPFFRNFLVGTLVFSGFLFGAFEFTQWKIPALKASPVVDE